jgi:Protein of unknown function (DUF1475)
MRNATILLTLGFIVMAIGIAYALIQGNFFDELEIMRSLPWFHLSMLDLYIGFFLFSGWILYRERTLVHAVVWIILLLSLGNLTACLYAVFALVRSRGNWQRFWMGVRSVE